MKTSTVGTVTVLEPENDADVLALERRRKAGTIDPGLGAQRRKAPPPPPARVREAKGSDDHFYGAWHGGSKASGGGPVHAGPPAGQGYGGYGTWHQKDKAHDTAVAKEVKGAQPAAEISRKTAQFEQQGGDIRTAGGWDVKLADQDVDSLVNNMEYTPRAMLGVEFTHNAMKQDEFFVARTKEGHVAGAIGWSMHTKNTPTPSLYVEYLGTTGIADGAGSALFGRVLREAASRHVGITMQAIADAQPFWAKMGMRPWRGHPDSDHWRMGAARVRELVGQT